MELLLGLALGALAATARMDSFTAGAPVPENKEWVNPNPKIYWNHLDWKVLLRSLYPLLRYFNDDWEQGKVENTCDNENYQKLETVVSPTILRYLDMQNLEPDINWSRTRIRAWAQKLEFKLREAAVRAALSQVLLDAGDPSHDRSFEPSLVKQIDRIMTQLQARHIDRLLYSEKPGDALWIAADAEESKDETSYQLPKKGMLSKDGRICSTKCSLHKNWGWGESCMCPLEGLGTMAECDPAEC